LKRISYTLSENIGLPIKIGRCFVRSTILGKNIQKCPLVDVDDIWGKGEFATEGKLRGGPLQAYLLSHDL
jgi:hypothetical protein